MYVKRLQNVNNNFLENDIGIRFNQSREWYSIIIISKRDKKHITQRSLTLRDDKIQRVILPSLFK